MAGKRKADLEREVRNLESLVLRQKQLLKDSEEREKPKVWGRLMGELRGVFFGAFALVTAVYAVEFDSPGTISKLFRTANSPHSPSALESVRETPSSVIDTIPELQEFLGTDKSGTLDDRTRAYIQSFQEKCNYVLGIPMAITREPSIETYVTATVIQSSPELKARLESTTHYSYTNRTILNYSVQIPNIAVSRVKSRLRDNRDIDEALDYHDPTIVRIAQELTAGMEQPLAKVTRLLQFVQALPYNFDIDDYPKHPLETLADGGGDCEDTSALYASLVRAVGIPSGVIDVPHHAMAAVNIPDGPGWYVEIAHKKYTLAETTGDWPLGDIAKDYQGRSRILGSHLLP